MGLKHETTTLAIKAAWVVRGNLDPRRAELNLTMLLNSSIFLYMTIQRTPSVGLRLGGKGLGSLCLSVLFYIVVFFLSFDL